MHIDTPSEQLLKEIRAALVLKGTSLSAFCKVQGFHRQAVSMALSGERSGPKSKQLAVDFLIAVRSTK